MRRQRAVLGEIGQPYEWRESQTLAEWLTIRGHFFCHIPNETRGPVAWHRKRKAMGVQAGMPDFLIFDGRMAIEMKRRRGGRLSDKQKECLIKLADRGWRVYVAAGAGDAIDWLVSLGL